MSTTHSRVNRLKISVFDIKAPEYVYFIKTYTETAISSILQEMATVTSRHT